MMTTHEKIQLLDHGYILEVEHWGSDENIIASARMSTEGSFRGWGPIVSDDPCKTCNGTGETDDRGYALVGQPYFSKQKCTTCEGDGKARKPGDEKLLRFLWEMKHSTPFESAGLTVEVQAPILVFREWHRHRTQSYNELSARYTPLPDINYIPSVERLLMGSDGKNKQAGTIKDAEVLTGFGAQQFREQLQQQYAAAEELYQSALKYGVPKELARVIVPVGRYSRMRASANLRNWFQFLTLRMAPGAQWEIRQFANALGERIIAERFPRTWALFNESMPKGTP